MANLQNWCNSFRIIPENTNKALQVEGRGLCDDRTTSEVLVKKSCVKFSYRTKSEILDVRQQICRIGATDFQFFPKKPKWGSNVTIIVFGKKSCAWVFFFETESEIQVSWGSLDVTSLTYLCNEPEFLNRAIQFCFNNL